MIKNYFFLGRFIFELKDVLAGSVLTQVFSQDKDRIIFEFNNHNNEKYLEVSTNPGLPFINLRKNFRRAKRNTISFFETKLPSQLTDICIAKSDRIIKLFFKNFDIYFAIRGKFTNVVLIDYERQFESFKKYEDDYALQFIDEVGKTDFINEFLIPDIEVIDNDDFINNVKKKYPFFGKEIFNEYNARYFEKANRLDILQKILNDALFEKPSVSINKNSGDIFLLPHNFYKYNCTEEKIFESIIDAFNYFLHQFFQLEEIKYKRKQVEKYLVKELSRITSKLNNLKAQTDKGSREEEYNKLANLLLININSIKKGLEVIEIEDIYDGGSHLKIKIDPSLSPKQNADRYFEKARNERINIQKSHQLYSQAQKRYADLQIIKVILESYPSIKEINELMKKLNIKTGAEKDQKQDVGTKFKQYIISNKYRVYVGKDSKSNDLLTTKFAKQNDYWFHARAVSGSHVVLRVHNPKETIPKDILKSVASLAAYHSKSKTAGVVPVSYCLKKYVVKKKGMPAGTVTLLREDTLLVKPEVPSNAEFVSSEI